MAFARTAVSITGNTTINSTSVTNVSSTAQLWVNMNVYGSGIPTDTIITAISGTTITLSRNATATATGVTITGQYITQSGTDTDPTGLAAMTGVTTIDTGSGVSRRIVFNLGTNQLRIQGTFTHDPDLYEIDTPLQQGFVTNSGAVYNYGIARTVNGQVTYSKGTGLVSTYLGGQFTNFGIHFENGTINWNGGVIRTCGSLLTSFASVISNSYDSVWQMWNGADTQYRTVSATPTFNAITMQGISNNILLFLNAGWNAFGVKFERCSFQSAAGGGVNRTILNPVFIGNQSSSDLITNQTVNTQQVITVKNPDRFPVFAKLATNAYMDMPVVEAVNLSVTDAANTAVGASEVVAYIKDTNNGSRLNSTVTTYTTDRTYIASSTSGGAVNLGDVLTLAGVNLNTSSSTVNYDYRSNFGNNSADFNIYLGGYSYLQAVTRQTLMGNGGKSVTWTMFSDSNVTSSRTSALALLGTKFTVDPVAKTVTATANATLDELYDATKAYKYQGTITAFEAPEKDKLIVSATGGNLTGYAGWSLIVNTGVTLSSGTKFSYVYFPTVTLNGTGSITAIYASTAGTSTIWRFSGVQVGSSIVVYDASGVTKYFQGSVTSAGDYNYYIPPGTSGTYFWAVEKYGKQRESGSFAANTGGLLFYAPLYVEDVGISQTNQSTVAAYTAIDNLDKFYDYTAFRRLSEDFIKIGQIATRSGTAVDIGNYNLKVNSAASVMESIATNTITIKSGLLASGSKYTTIIATPPRTVTAQTTEIITANIEDGNGNSSVTIQGGSGNFTLWKLLNSVPDDDYATGVNLGNVGNITYRFLSDPGYKIIIRDNTTAYRINVPMDKGVYTRGLFFGSQVQLAQSAEVTQINTKVDILTNNVAAVQTDVDAIQVKTDGLTFTIPNVLDANIQYVNDIEVKGTGEDNDPWNPV